MTEIKKTKKGNHVQKKIYKMHVIKKFQCPFITFTGN